MSKVAIVTGAGQGIGFAIAKRLVQDGFKVGVLDYNAETAEKAVAELSAENALAVVADVSKQAEVAATVSFLAGPDSNYIAGQTVIVDGGMQFH